jgi:hypothetical protein
MMQIIKDLKFREKYHIIKWKKVKTKELLCFTLRLKGKVNKYANFYDKYKIKVDADLTKINGSWKRCVGKIESVSN